MLPCVAVAQVFEELRAGGVFEESSIAPGHLFLSVHDAVLFAQHKLLTSGRVEEVSHESRDKVREVCLFYGSFNRIFSKQILSSDLRKYEQR